MVVAGTEQRLCACYKERQEFHKVLDLKDAGLVVYCHTLCSEGVIQGGVVGSTITTSQDLCVILHNTKDVKVTPAEIIPALEKNDISCPRCRKLFDHAQKLLQDVKSVDKKNAMGVCDHCLKKAQSKKPCDICAETVKKFLSSREEKKDEMKRYLQLWLSKMRHIVKDVVTETTKAAKPRAYSELQIDRLCQSSPKAIRQPKVKQMFHPELHKSDSNLYADLDPDEKGQKLRKTVVFNEVVEPFAVMPYEKGIVDAYKQGPSLVETDRTFDGSAYDLQDSTTRSERQSQKPIIREIPKIAPWEQEAKEEKDDSSIVKEVTLKLERDSSTRGISPNDFSGISDKGSSSIYVKVIPRKRHMPRHIESDSEKYDKSRSTDHRKLGELKRKKIIESGTDVTGANRKHMVAGDFEHPYSEQYRHEKDEYSKSKKSHDTKVLPKTLKRLEDGHLTDDEIKLQHKIPKLSHKTEEPGKSLSIKTSIRSKKPKFEKDSLENILQKQFSYFFPKSMEKEAKKPPKIGAPSSHLIRTTHEKIRQQAEEEKKRHEQERERKLEEKEKKRLEKEEKKRLAEEKKQEAQEQKKHADEQKRLADEEHRKRAPEEELTKKAMIEEEKKKNEERDRKENLKKDLASKYDQKEKKIDDSKKDLKLKVDAKAKAVKEQEKDSKAKLELKAKAARDRIEATEKTKKGMTKLESTGTKDKIEETDKTRKDLKEKPEPKDKPDSKDKDKETEKAKIDKSKPEPRAKPGPKDKDQEMKKAKPESKVKPESKGKPDVRDEDKEKTKKDDRIKAETKHKTERLDETESAKRDKVKAEQKGKTDLKEKMDGSESAKKEIRTKSEAKYAVDKESEKIQKEIKTKSGQKDKTDKDVLEKEKSGIKDKDAVKLQKEKDKQDRDELAKKDSDERAKKERDEQAKKDSDKRAKKERDEQAKKDSDEQANKDHDKQAKKDRDEQAKKDRDEQAKKDSDERAKKGRDEQAKKDRDEQAKKDSDEQAKKDSDERAKKGRDEQAKKDSDEQAKKNRDEQAKKGRDEQAKKDSDERAKKDRDEQAKKDSEERAKKGRDEQAKTDRDEQAKKDSDERPKKGRDEQAKTDRDEQAKKDSDERAKKGRDEHAKKDRDEQAKKDSDERAKKGRDEQSKKNRDEQAKKDSDERAKKDRDEQAKKDHGEQAKKDSEERAKKGRDEQAKTDRDEQAKKDREQNEILKQAEQLRKEKEAITKKKQDSKAESVPSDKRDKETSKQKEKALDFKGMKIDKGDLSEPAVSTATASKDKTKDISAKAPDMTKVKEIPLKKQEKPSTTQDKSLKVSDELKEDKIGSKKGTEETGEAQFRKLQAELAKEKELQSKLKKQEEAESKKAREMAEKKAKENEKIASPQIREAKATPRPEPPRPPPPPPKIEPKRVDEPVTEVKQNNIKVHNTSIDDLILRLVRIRQTTVDLKSRQKPYNIDPAMIKAHKCHHELGSQNASSCDLCKNSELEIDVESFENNVNIKTDMEIIIGENIFKYKAPPLFEKPEKKEIVPIFFQSMYEVEPVPLTPETVPSTPVISEPINKPLKDAKGIELEPGKGIIRYALSDRTFIDKGWTMLPTEKVVRKMNVYRMRPAHPEFDWFEHNKNKRLMTYDTGEKLAEFDDNGRGRWYYRNGRLALDYYDAEETNAQQRFVIYSSGEPDERGRSHPITILATFDYLGNGIVFDHAGKIRLKYNQTEGVVLDRGIGPVSHWKWHTLNDPPVLQQVMIDTQMAHKDPQIIKLGTAADNKIRPDNEEMLAIEFDNFIKEKSKKLSQKFKPFQIKMKALKINEHFSLKVLDQATVYLIFRDGSTNLKLNIGMILDHQEIVDTDTAEVGEVSNNLERFPARTDSLAGLQRSVAYAQRYERARTERERRLRPSEPCESADQLTAAASPPLRLPLRTVPTGSTSSAANCRCRKPTNNLYYNTRLL